MLITGVKYLNRWKVARSAQVLISEDYLSMNSSISDICEVLIQRRLENQ